MRCVQLALSLHPRTFDQDGRSARDKCDSDLKSIFTEELHRATDRSSGLSVECTNVFVGGISLADTVGKNHW